MARRGHPVKYWNENDVGEDVQIGYGFLDKLFEREAGAKIRARIWREAQTGEPRLRRLLQNSYGLKWIPRNAHIMVIDIENARVWPDPLPEGWRRKDWYTLVLPPRPRRSNSEDYRDAQAWASAWYHAMADSYGM